MVSPILTFDEIMESLEAIHESLASNKVEIPYNVHHGVFKLNRLIEWLREARG